MFHNIIFLLLLIQITYGNMRNFLNSTECVLWTIYPYFNVSHQDLYRYPFNSVMSLLLDESVVNYKMECPPFIRYVDPKFLSSMYRNAIYSKLNRQNIGINLYYLNCLLHDDTYREKISRVLAVISYQQNMFGRAIYHAMNSLQYYPMDKFLMQLIELSLRSLNLPVNTTFFNEVNKLHYMNHYNHDSAFKLIQVDTEDLKIYETLLDGQQISYGDQFNKNLFYNYLIGPAITLHYNTVCNANGNELQQEVYRLCDKFNNLNNFTPKMVIDWSMLPPVKLLCAALPSLDGTDSHNIFQENCLGFSDSLWLLNVPNQIVSSVEKNDDSLYILFYNYPEPSLLTLGYPVIPENYIIYNQEKNAHIQSEEYPNTGFTLKCHADYAIDNFTYPSSFVKNSLLIWEYSQCNINNWKPAGKRVFYMPQALPFSLFYETCQNLNMEYLFNDKEFSTEFDVLFYGANYDYRSSFFDYSTKANGNPIKMYKLTNKVLSSKKRDYDIDQSKIVLNLRSCDKVDGHFNSHRVRFLIGKAKLVISDESGCTEDEKLYLDNNAVHIADNTDKILQSIKYFVDNRVEAQKYEMSGFRYVLKDTIMNIFEEDINEDACKNSKSFIIQLACSMDYAKKLLIDKMNIQIDRNMNNHDDTKSRSIKKIREKYSMQSNPF